MQQLNTVRRGVPRFLNGQAVCPSLKQYNQSLAPKAVLFFGKLSQEESRQFGKTESPGIHQESPNTRLAQTLEPCTPYYDLRTASHGYDETTRGEEFLALHNDNREIYVIIFYREI